MLRDLHAELTDIQQLLPSKGTLLYPDIWESAIASGQIRLLKSEQVIKLAHIYRTIKGTDYETMRVRELAEDAKQESDWQTRERLTQLWKTHEQAVMERENTLRTQIEALLKEEWWDVPKTP